MPITATWTRGRVVVSLWCKIEDSPYFDALVQAVTTHINAETAAGLRAAFKLSDSEHIRDLLTGSGFTNARATVKQLDLELPHPRDFVPHHVSATPMSAGFHAASEEARRAVIDEVSERMKRYETARGIRVPFRTHLVMRNR